MAKDLQSAFEKSIDFSWKEPLDAAVFFHMLEERMQVSLQEDGTVWVPLLGRPVQVAEFLTADLEERKAEGEG
ncbi:MAG: hypothetical protein IJU00_04760 [Selenomonas sp.]|nr:hypothetical protein [Selenomonas sp.]